MSDSIVVGISDYKTGSGTESLVTYALGSCVGICLYDRYLKIGGLSHIMLPNSRLFSQFDVNRMKFADTALPDMLAVLKRMGANPARITAKIAGGAQMFRTATNSNLAMIGERNVKQVKETLFRLNIPIIAEDTGLNYGRTIYFDMASGMVKVHAMNNQIREM